MAKGQQRDLKKEAFWRSVLARFAKSGLSVRAFCRREKVTEPTFYAWRRVIRERDIQRPQVRRHQERIPSFVPVMVRDELAVREDAAITVAWPSGRTLRLPATIAAARLAELVRAMEAEPVAEAQP